MRSSQSNSSKMCTNYQFRKTVKLELVLNQFLQTYSIQVTSRLKKKLFCFWKKVWNLECLIMSLKELCIFFQTKTFSSWKNASTLYPALVQAQHSDKETVVEQLKTISDMLNPNHEDYALWTMSFKPAMMTEKMARSLGASKSWQGNT